MICTIVSFYPQPIHEEKSSINPGTYLIPPSDGKTPKILHIESGYSRVYLDEHRGSLQVTIPAEEIAESICRDFSASMIAYEDDAKPGIFWLEGRLTVDEVLKKHSDKCNEALRKQKNWFTALVKLADDEWKKTQQLKAISGLQRFACNFLNLERAWNVEAEVLNSMRCPACATIISAGIAICPNCTAILDREKAKQFEFAGKK